MDKNYDFSGWATRNNVRCSDGRTIMKDAFAECDGLRVPLVWGHRHDEPATILGHALLENRDEGVYTYGFFFFFLCCKRHRLFPPFTPL